MKLKCLNDCMFLVTDSKGDTTEVGFRKDEVISDPKKLKIIGKDKNFIEVKAKEKIK